MRNIVALVDLDDDSSWRKVLPVAIDHAKHTEARLHVLSVIPDGMFKMTIVAQLIPEDYERRLTDDGRQRLATLIREHSVDDVQVEQVVRLGNVYKEALGFARDVDADLIVVGAHKPELKDYVANKAAVVFLRGMIAFKNGESHAMPSALVIWGATGSLLDKIEQAYPESWVIRPKE